MQDGRIKRNHKIYSQTPPIPMTSLRVPKHPQPPQSRFEEKRMHNKVDIP